jgi:hypothetical protein
MCAWLSLARTGQRQARASGDCSLLVARKHPCRSPLELDTLTPVPRLLLGGGSQGAKTGLMGGADSCEWLRILCV